MPHMVIRHGDTCKLNSVLCMAVPCLLTKAAFIGRSASAGYLRGASPIPSINMRQTYHALFVNANNLHYGMFICWLLEGLKFDYFMTWLETQTTIIETCTLTYSDFWQCPLHDCVFQSFAEYIQILMVKWNTCCFLQGIACESELRSFFKYSATLQKHYHILFLAWPCTRWHIATFL